MIFINLDGHIDRIDIFVGIRHSFYINLFFISQLLIFWWTTIRKTSHLKKYHFQQIKNTCNNRDNIKMMNKIDGIDEICLLKKIMIFNFQVMNEGSLVKGWAESTQSKIRQFVDDYLINYPQDNVRKSTEKLLASLFRKGTEQQRMNILTLLTQRVGILNSMGKSSKQFLSLISNIFENFKGGLYSNEKSELFRQIVLKTKQIFEKTVKGKQYPFYSLCANMIDFGNEFKPYLLQANGCLKCYGKPQIDFQTANINTIRDELRVHLNSAQWIFKRKYEINNLTIAFTKKKLGYKTISIYYYGEDGLRKQLGKYGLNDTIPPFNFTASSLGITFQFNKSRRNNHVSCLACSNPEEYSTVCSNCLTKMIQIEGKIKVIGGNPEKINKQLSDSFKNFNSLRGQLEKFAQSVQDHSKVSLIKVKIVQEMQSSYLNIIQNLRLLRDVSEAQLNEQKKKYQKICTDCYSCHFYQFNSCIDFILNTLKKSQITLQSNQVINLINDFRSIFVQNRIQANTINISYILAQLYSKLQQIDYFSQIALNKQNSSIVASLFINLIQHIKKQRKNQSFLDPIKKYLFDEGINNHFNIVEKINLFVVLVLSQQQYFYVSETEDLQPQKLQDLKRLSLQQYSQYNSLLNFKIQSVFDHKITNIMKLYLVLIPDEFVPYSSLDISDAGYLKYIKNKLPIIDEQFILSNIVFSPNPILKLNIFKLLPQIIDQLPLESSIELIKQLCKFKPLWNTYILQTVEAFDKKLQNVEKQRKLMLCLEGYQSSKQNLYFQHIYKMLTPQRPNFIIRLQIPQKQMQKQQKNKGGPVEYIYLPIRQIKSQDLKGDTIGALHQWITVQLKKLNQDMAFDLIVENNIVDNLDLSLEIIYRKIVQKEVKRQIGNKTYDFFRVIYRIQGIFGEANERNCGNPRDEMLQQCINFSSNLLNKLSNKRTGVDVIMQIIPTLQRKIDYRDTRQKMIKLLEIIFRNQTIIRKVVEWQYGNFILSFAIKFISLGKHQLRTTEVLLQMCSKIIDEANKEMIRLRKNSGISGRKYSEGQMDIEDGGEESQKAVKSILQKVKEAQENGLKHISKKLIKILPFCSKDDINSSKYLLQFFEMSRILEIKYTPKLTWLFEFIQALSQSFSSLKTLCRQQGITQKLVSFIIAHISIFENEKNKEVIENLQICIIFLKGLIQGDIQLQDYLFEKGVLQQIYRIGAVGSSGLTEQAKAKLGKIPSICFEIVKYFQEGKIISPQVHDYFAQNEERKRKSILSQKNLRKQQIMNKKKKAMQSFQHLIKNEQVQLLSCSSCKQGYSKKKQVLGVYLYSSKLQMFSLDSWWKDNKKIQSVTSTSYFEPIHLECHNNAMKDDLKLQKTEWDGAIIRNSQVLCNNWCAFKGPQTTDEEFDKVYRKYFQKNNKGNGFWIIINDLNGLLEKFSKEYNFALETKGSSYTHNCKLIPVLMSFASHLMKNADQIKYLKEGFTHIEEHLTKKPNLIYLYFCLLLFFCNYQSMKRKQGFCLKLIDNLGYGHFKDSKPLYIYLAMVQGIGKLTHQFEREGLEIIQHLNTYIPKNFNNLLQSFQVIAEEYKNVYLKWENIEQAKKYFQP